MESAAMRPWNCWVTVSYTHLDVYKRQLRHFTGADCNGRTDRSLERNHAGTCHGDNRRPEILLYTDSVSYTHLDVYKRQFQLLAEDYFLFTHLTYYGLEVVNYGREHCSLYLLCYKDSSFNNKTCLLYTSRCV